MLCSWRVRARVGCGVETWVGWVLGLPEAAGMDLMADQ